MAVVYPIALNIQVFCNRSDSDKRILIKKTLNSNFFFMAKV